MLIRAEHKESGSTKMSHSIFHQTVLCQTQTVAEHPSKLGSRGITANNTLFQSPSVNKGKKLLLSTNFRGTRLCVRKRKLLAMGRNRHAQAIPRAVLTSNPASEVFSKRRNMLIVITSFRFLWMRLLLLLL